MTRARAVRLRWAYVASLIGFAACGSGDNSAAIKAHAGVKPGMPIWEALDFADQTQFPDISFTAWGKECSHPGVEVGRRSGPVYLKILKPQMDPKYPVSGYAYTQQGFASREEFVAAVKENVSLFSACKSIVFVMGRYQGWPAADSFGVTVDGSGRITAVTPLEAVQD